MVKLGGPPTAPRHIRHAACAIRRRYVFMVITHGCFTRPGGCLPSLCSRGSRERWGPLAVPINLLSPSRFLGGLISWLNFAALCLRFCVGVPSSHVRPDPGATAPVHTRSAILLGRQPISGELLAHQSPPILPREERRSFMCTRW